MSASHFSGEVFHEIVGVGTYFPQVARSPAAGANGDGVEYWSRSDLCPDAAHNLVDAISAAIGKSFNTNPAALRVFVRTAPSRRRAHYFDARATLVYCPGHGDELHQLSQMRSAAACLLAGLQRPSLAGHASNPTFLLPGEEATSSEALMTSPAAKLLGMRITDDMVACVPGRADIEFKCKFRDAPRQCMAEDTFEVRGRLSSTKSSGLYRAVGVSGLIANVAARAEFKQSKVLFAEELRESIARAVSEPSRQLLMSITRTAIPCGRAEPRLTFTLKSLRFDQ